MKDLRAVLSPLIREVGVTATARRLGVSDVALHRWMAGHQSISAEKEKKMTQMLGYKVVTKIEIIPLDRPNHIG